MTRKRRKRPRKDRIFVEKKSPHSAVDGVSYFQAIPEVRRKLRGTDLLSGNIWPVEEEEKKQWNAHATEYLMAASRIIGTTVEDHDKIGIDVEAPERIFSSQLKERDGKSIIVGETASGTIELETPDIVHVDKRFLELTDGLRVLPLGNPDLIFNACSTALSSGGHRLILSIDDIALVEERFWKKLILVGLETLGDIEKKAAEEFAKSPNGIFLRLRKMAEKIAESLGKEPLAVVRDIISSAVLQSGFTSDIRWFIDRTETEEDLDFVCAAAYAMLAREGVNPKIMMGIAKSTAENIQYRHEYRDWDKESFSTRGLTQLFFEMFQLGEKVLERDIDGLSLTLEMAQYHAQAFQFLREMQEMVSNRNLFMGYITNGYFDSSG